METIKLSKNSFWFKFWGFITLTDTTYGILPFDTCALRRDLLIFTLLAILCAPFRAVSVLLHYFDVWDETDIGKGFYMVGIVVQFLAIGIGAVIAKKASFLIIYLIGTACTLVGLLAVAIFIALLAFIITFIANQISKMHHAKELARITAGIPKTECIITTVWNNLKDKVCSRIEYID